MTAPKEIKMVAAQKSLNSILKKIIKIGNLEYVQNGFFLQFMFRSETLSVHFMSRKTDIMYLSVRFR